MTLLTVENLNASIEGVPVLRNISVSVEEGETVALVGRNGAGKTTTLQTIMGLLAITNGTITFRNEAIAGLSTHERKRRGIGFAPEDRRLISNLTARENIQLSLWGTDDENAFDATERFEEVLNLFPEMESFLDRGARHLSGGEQQMVTVSRALIADPDLLLLDEPFEGLAPSIAAQLREGINQISELGVSVVIAESQLNHVVDTVRRLYVIERGEIVLQTDRPVEVYDNKQVMGIIGG